MSNFTTTNRSNPCQACGDASGKCRTTDSKIILCMNTTDRYSTPRGWKFLGTTNGGYFAGKLAPIEDDNDGLTDLERRVERDRLKVEREAKRAIEDEQRVGKLPTLVQRNQTLSKKPNTLTPTQSADLIKRGLTQSEIDWCLLQGYLWAEIDGYGIACIDPVTGLIVGGKKANDKRGQTYTDRDGLEKITPKYSWLLKGEAKLKETDQNPLTVWKHPEFDQTQPADIRLCEKFLGSLVAAIKAWRTSKQIIYIGAGGSTFQDKALARVLSALPQHEDCLLCPDAGAVVNPSVMAGYRKLADQLPDLKVLWWSQFKKGSSPDIDELSENQKTEILTWQEFYLISIDLERQDELEHFHSDRDRFGLLDAARFSNKSEDFWLGNGLTSKVCGGLRGNIKNGWVAIAVSVGQALASLTPRSLRITPPDGLTSLQCSLAWILIEALKSGGKSPVFLTVKPFLDALEVLEWSRSKDVAAIRREIVKMESNDELPGESKPVINNSLHSIEPSVVLGDFTIAYLKTAMAAANYWPRLAKESHTTIQMQSCGTLIFCREAVQFFENLGAFNQRNSAAQSFLAGAWAGEVEIVGRKTGGELTRPGDVALGMVLACQPNQFSQIISNESSKNAVDTGFGIRFDVTTLENTDRKDLKFERRVTATATQEKIDLFPTLRKFQTFVGSIDQIVSDEAAAELYEHELFPWLNSEDLSGWLDGYASKAVANTLRLAWAFQCIEIFDAIASGDRPSPRISVQSMARAIEKTKLSLASLRFHVANMENDRTITAKLKESEQQNSIVKSKYGAILTDPQLTHDFVSGHRSQGVKSFRSLLQKINGKARRDLKEIGIDASAVLRPIWDDLEALAVIPTSVILEAAELASEIYEYQGD